MNMKFLLLIGITLPLALLFVPAALAVRGDSYGNCDSPLSSYKCYDFSETPYCPQKGLEYVKGWCADPPGRTTRCCAPAGTPEGLRTGGPGIDLSDIKSLKTQNFQLFLEGTLSCRYKVVSNGQTTRDDKFPCDSYVTITVGPNGDCRDEGIDTCKVISDGGLLELGKTYGPFSIKFQPAEKKYGFCRFPYQTFQCMQRGECITRGATPIKGYCLGSPPAVQCCVHAESPQTKGSFVFEKTKEKTLHSVARLDEKLRQIKEKYGVTIILEIVDDIPPNAEKNLRDKFHLLYKIGEGTTTGIDLILVYSKSKNIWRGVGFQGCKLPEQAFREILSDPKISGKFDDKDYDNALENFIILLEDAVAGKLKAGPCTDAAIVEKKCSDVCNEWYSRIANIFRDCANECSNAPGCVWDQNTCKDADAFSVSSCFEVGKNEKLCKNKNFMTSKGLSCTWDFKECMPQYKVDKILIDYGEGRATACGSAGGKELYSTITKGSPELFGPEAASLPRGTVMKIFQWIGGYNRDGTLKDGPTTTAYETTWVPYGKEDVIKGYGGKTHAKYQNPYGPAMARLATAKAQVISGKSFAAGKNTGKQLHGTHGPLLDDFFDDRYNYFCSNLPIYNIRIVTYALSGVQDAVEFLIDDKLQWIEIPDSTSFSHGCLRVSNRFILWLRENAPIGTLVYYIDSSQGDSTACSDYPPRV